VKPFCFTLFFLLLFPAYSQALPDEMDLGLQGTYATPYVQHFYPLGFSDPDSSGGSYFAFILYANSSSGRGEETDFRFIIQDLATDEWLVNYEFRSHPPERPLTFLPATQERLLRDYASEVPYLGPRFLWDFLHAPVVGALTDYQIQLGQPLELQSFPFRLEDQLYMLRIEEFIVPENLGGDYWVALYKTGQLSKKITDAENTFFLSLRSPGVIMSPFEKRVVVLLIKELPGFEGPPSDLKVLTVGAHLTEGFKPWGGRAYIENQ
jgi:hypothetical protein